MDILYVVGHGTSWCNNFELRCSLRSIAKFGKNVDRVFVVGYCPDWFSDEVIKIPYDHQLYPAADEVWKKGANINSQVYYAIDNSDIGEEFLVSHDDHLYIDNVDFNNYPFYARIIEDSCEIKTQYEIPTMYRRFLCDSRAFLESKGLPFVNFTLHRNMHLSRESLNAVRDMYYEAIDGDHRGVELYVLVNNWRLVNQPFEYVPVIDYKTTSDKSWQDIKPENTNVFSTPDFGIGSFAYNFLDNLYPDKCKYEI